MFRVVLERDSERHRRKVTEQRNGTEAGGKASPPLWNMVADIPLSLQPGSHWRLITLAGRSGHVHGRPKAALVVAAEENRIVVASEPGQGNAALWPLTVIGHPRETIQERAEVQIEAAGGGGGGKAAECLANSHRFLEDVCDHRRPGSCWRAKTFRRKRNFKR